MISDHSWFAAVRRICSVTVVSISIVLCFGGLAAHGAEQANSFVKVFSNAAPGSPSKDIYIFMDGTSNDGSSNTNVWRMYNKVSSLPGATGIYLSGVGTAEDPFDVRHLGSTEAVVELALGKNMQTRIIAGYEFVTLRFNPGDRIFIFGFSRGAHQARALAGLLSYAGVLKLSDAERQSIGSEEDYERTLMGSGVPRLSWTHPLERMCGSFKGIRAYAAKMSMAACRIVERFNVLRDVFPR